MFTKHAAFMSLLVAAAPAFAQPSGAELRPGFTLRVYQSETAPEFVLEPTADQTPNVDVLRESMDLKEPADFGGLDSNFVASATGWFNAKVAGTYAFRLCSDDGSILSIDGKPLVRNDGVHPTWCPQADVELSEGLHALRVRMFEASGGQVLKLEVKTPGAADFSVVDGRWISTEKDAARAVAPGFKKFTSNFDGHRAVLVFSKTAGFRHDSIPEGIALVRSLGVKDGYAVIATEDARVFTDDSLARFDCVIFLNTTGDVLDDAQQTAFEKYYTRGNGYVGVHSASDTEYEWPFYGELVGAYFKQHPAIQPAQIEVTEPRHASTRHLPAVWSRTDEWYDFRASPREGVNKILMLNEGSYKGGGMNGNHPIAWWSEFKGGRSFYTALGHTKQSYAEPEFVEHLRRAVLWAARYEDSNK